MDTANKRVFNLQVIPAPVLILKNLTSFSMASNRLETLPEGDWQQGLENANFANNRLRPDSPVLAALVLRLKSLDLSGNAEKREKLARAEVIRLSRQAQT